MSKREVSVKVVLINTRYVKTEATDFKSVVQSLTGKDSSVAWIEKADAFARTIDGNAERKHLSHANVRDSNPRKSEVIETGKIGHSMLSNGMSFKDFDRMLSEMPPLEDLQDWLSDDYYSQ